ncbi:NAD(P)H-dependent flavin oxidoreductase [Thalassolituus sp. UBA3500]|uniref:NAD(P)H-dependent flavin oxidoreductase n=1 Tax=Thalassolituus sp. UBA3500 TaxID=1947664 RepID=UPI000C110853|nr:nitronate monooxygenase family protein [Thalassolituus sp. UBA3500]MBN59703.1 nitronate monooxygenase [Oceanospirillaceae bacterium]
MSLPDSLRPGLKLPVVVAPMFLASGPSLVTECCKAGVIGTFPALNQRSSEGLDQWLTEIRADLDAHAEQTGEPAAAFGVNLVVHKSNARLQQDLEIIVKHKVPLVITSLGAVQDVVDAVHSYGGVVFHDVVNTRFARKAASVGVDGLIAVCGGAGGHAGDWNPFALINELKQFFDKTILLAGSLSTGRDVATAKMMGADMAYMGTRFIGTQECQVQPEYKEMLTTSSAGDIVYTPKISGVNASFLKPSLDTHDIDLATHQKPDHVDFGAELDTEKMAQATSAKPWKDLWSAGHGVGSIADVPTTAELVARLKAEYQNAVSSFTGDF